MLVRTGQIIRIAQYILHIGTFHNAKEGKSKSHDDSNGPTNAREGNQGMREATERDKEEFAIERGAENDGEEAGSKFERDDTSTRDEECKWTINRPLVQRVVCRRYITGDTRTFSLCRMHKRRLAIRSATCARARRRWKDSPSGRNPDDSRPTFNEIKETSLFFSSSLLLLSLAVF